MSDESPLSDADRALLSQMADAFFTAISRGQTLADWEPYLANAKPHLRLVFLAELVIIDIGQRWKRGERALVEQYVDRFPEIGPLDKVSPKLISEEYRARLRAGDARDVDQYRRRFPVQFRQLEDELLRIEQESSTRKPSGSQRASGTLRTADFTATKPPTGTVRDSANIRPSGVIGSATRSRVSEYKRSKRLGAGQFGEVWLVETITGIKKALKVMHRPPDDEGGKRELRSLDLIKNEQHPYLLRTEDYWIEDSKLYVLMELADCTLRNWLAEFNPGKESREYTNGVPPGELLHVMREAAEVMDHLHEKQVMHRDIKPDNILMLNRHAKVADFGLARHQDAGVATQSVMAGSPAYMAPETWSGRAGAASDLYSLAITYAELRQGCLPVRLGPMTEIMFAHLEGNFDFRTDKFTKPELVVVRKALSKEPGQRYGSCSEFVGELIKAVGIPLSLPLYKKLAGTKVDLPPLPPTATPQPVSHPPHRETLGFERDIETLEPTRPKPPTERETQPVVKPKRPTTKRKTNWVGVIIAGVVILGLIGLIGYLVLSGLFQPPTSGGTTPTTDGTPSTDVPTPTSKPGVGIITPTTKLTPDDPWTPEGTTPDSDRMVPIGSGRRVPLWVKKTVNGEKMRFRYIKPNDSQVGFYLGETKVSNRAYDTPTGPGGASAPATYMSAEQAMTFIKKHFGKAKGRLPTPNEWDHAAGLYPTPTQTGVSVGTPRVRLKEPVAPMGDGKKDENQNELIDMAGNGREWTCGVMAKLDTPSQVTPKLDGQFAAEDLVMLRGWNFSFKNGLTFEQLAKHANGESLTQYAGEPSPYTGFRVLLPVPEK